MRSLRQPYLRGVMTLTLLILLSSLLLVFMLFNDDILRLHGALAAQRKIYVTQNSRLQQLIRAEKASRCEALPLQSEEKSRLIAFEQTEFAGGTGHFIWCRRQMLFRQVPKTGPNEGKFTEFIQSEAIPVFQSFFRLPPAVLPKDKDDYFYWFPAGQTQWTLNGNIYAVVVAEGALTIGGKGRISGAVITGGNLTKDDEVQIAYRKSTVTRILQRYSRWLYAEKSWHDFSAE